MTILSSVLKTKGKKTILDADPEAQALLEMTGRSRHSEGLREPIGEDDDDDNWKKTERITVTWKPIFFFFNPGC